MEGPSREGIDSASELSIMNTDENWSFKISALAELSVNISFFKRRNATFLTRISNHSILLSTSTSRCLITLQVKVYQIKAC